MSAEGADLIAEATMLNVADVQIEMVVKGRGAPLLFLHGMDGIEGAVGLINLLAESHKVYAPSHPGFGTSALPKTFTSVDDLSYFYLDLIEQLDLRDVTFAGFSLGGWLAAEILIKNSSRASRAILGAPLGLRSGDRRQRRVTDIFMLGQRELNEKMQVTPVQAPASPPSEAMAERIARNAEAVGLFGWSPYMSNPKLIDRLHRIKAPVHILWGEQDAIAPVEYGKEYAAAIKGASLEVIPQCGHRIYVDKPDVAAKAIRNFSKTAAAVAA
ncbi:MAG: alpha/beta hydrolase [Alphaproteobacteria bacterium]